VLGPGARSRDLRHADIKTTLEFYVDQNAGLDDAIKKG